MGLCESRLNALSGTPSNRSRRGSRLSRRSSVSRPVYCPGPVGAPMAFSQDCGCAGTSCATDPCNTITAMPPGAKSMGNHAWEPEPAIFPSSGYQNNFQSIGYQGNEVITGISNNVVNPIWEVSTSASLLAQPHNLSKSLTAAKNVQSTDIQNIGYPLGFANGGTRLVNQGNRVETSVADVVPGYQPRPMITSNSGRNGDFQINENIGLINRQIGYPVGRETNVGAMNFSNTIHRSALGSVKQTKNFGSQMQPKWVVTHDGLQNRRLQNTRYPIGGIGHGVKRAKAKSCSLCETVDPF